MDSSFNPFANAWGDDGDTTTTDHTTRATTASSFPAYTYPSSQEPSASDSTPLPSPSHAYKPALADADQDHNTSTSVPDSAAPWTSEQDDAPWPSTSSHLQGIPTAEGALPEIGSFSPGPTRRVDWDDQVATEDINRPTSPWTLDARTPVDRDQSPRQSQSIDDVYPGTIRDLPESTDTPPPASHGDWGETYLPPEPMPTWNQQDTTSDDDRWGSPPKDMHFVGSGLSPDEGEGEHAGAEDASEGHLDASRHVEGSSDPSAVKLPVSFGMNLLLCLESVVLADVL